MSTFRPEVRRALPAVLSVRFAINVATRMGYTFLPAIARGVGMSVGAMSATISARELTALTAPWAGRLSDRHGALSMMSVGGLVAGGGLLLATLGVPGLVAGMIVLGLGRTLHQVALAAWVGNVVAYERRGRATGLIEVTWGAASLIGLPIVGLLISGVSWRAPFAVLGVAALVASVVIRRREDRPARAESIAAPKPRVTATVIAAIATNSAMAGAAQFLFLGHGLWLEDTYDLDTAEIGIAIVGVGAIEVIATTGSSRFTDRIGKRRSMLGGTALMTAMMLVLAVQSAPPLWLGLVILVVAFLGFEYGIVSAIPLISELDPEARAGVVGRSIGVATVVRAAVTFIAGAVYVHSGFSTLMMVASGFGLVAVALAAFVMTEPGTTTSERSPGTPTPRR